MMMTGRISYDGEEGSFTVTIISRETIKPSSPTPSHLNKYNLSELDQLQPHTYIPLVLFYPNEANCSLTADEKSRKLKESLSRSLSQYYPFAGRLHTPTTPYIDCSDEGVVFIEAKTNNQLDKFQNIGEKDEAVVRQLFPDGMVGKNAPNCTSIVGVQVNHFACGGIGVAVSMLHKISDGCTIGLFLSYWASVARYGATDAQEVVRLNPQFIQSHGNDSSLLPKTSVLNQYCVNQVSKRFVFPNSKLTDLKNKIILAGSTPPLTLNNPTRVEVLTALLYKAAVASLSSDNSLKPSYLLIPVDIRKKFVPMLPPTTVGNFTSLMMVNSRNSSETSLSMVVSEIQKAKKDIETVNSVQHAVKNFGSFMSRLETEDPESLAKRSFFTSSLCGFPYNKLDVDFGWGKATGATTILGSADWTGFMLMDTPDGHGIQARVILEKQHMEIFENHKELLSYCQS